MNYAVNFFTSPSSSLHPSMFHSPESSQVSSADRLQLCDRTACRAEAAPLSEPPPGRLDGRNGTRPAAVAAVPPAPLDDDGGGSPVQKLPALPVTSPRCLQTHSRRLLYTQINTGLFEEAESPPALQTWDKQMCSADAVTETDKNK